MNEDPNKKDPPNGGGEPLEIDADALFKAYQRQLGDLPISRDRGQFLDDPEIRPDDLKIEKEKKYDFLKLLKDKIPLEVPPLEIDFDIINSPSTIDKDPYGFGAAASERDLYAYLLNQLKSQEEPVWTSPDGQIAIVPERDDKGVIRGYHATGEHGWPLSETALLSKAFSGIKFDDNKPIYRKYFQPSDDRGGYLRDFNKHAMPTFNESAQSALAAFIQLKKLRDALPLLLTEEMRVDLGGKGNVSEGPEEPGF